MNLTLALVDFPEKDYKPDWIAMDGLDFEDKRVVVDNHQFRQCSFVRCTLIYAGGPCGFADCEFDLDTVVVYTGAAHRGLRLFQELRKRPSRLPPMA